MTTATVNRRAILAVPLAVAAAAGVGAYALLGRMRAGTYDPRGIPSPLIGKPVPSFSLPGPEPGTAGFSSLDLAGIPAPVLINFFASWCQPCAVEAPQLQALQASGVALWGIAYKDKPPATAGFLERFGRPYQRLARDDSGQTAIDFGVFGVPETFFIDRTGIIRWRWAGPLTEATIDQDLRPLLRTYA
jgi:cytochrome c biogenesis protein CcmG/thiol:disulfide interchange protein DsbE